MAEMFPEPGVLVAICRLSAALVVVRPVPVMANEKTLASGLELKMETVAVRVPAACGANCRVKVSVPPAAIVELGAVVTLKSPALAPLTWTRFAPPVRKMAALVLLVIV